MKEPPCELGLSREDRCTVYSTEEDCECMVISTVEIGSMLKHREGAMQIPCSRTVCILKKYSMSIRNAPTWLGY